MVVYVHCSGILALPTLNMQAGVDIFLIVSGFALAASSIETPVGKFIKSRFLRLFPAYWLALAIFILLKAPFSNAASVPSIILHAFAIHGFGPERYFFDINSADWYMTFIVSMYLVFLIVRKRIGDVPKMILASSVLTLVCGTIYLFAGNEAGLTNMTPRILSFFVGMIAGHIYMKRPVEKRLLVPAAMASIALLLASRTNFVGLLTAIVIILGWINVRKAIPSSALKIFSSLGLISYEIYLFHQPFVQEFNLYALRIWMKIPDPNRLEIFVSILTGIGITLCLSYLSRYIISSLRHRFFGRSIAFPVKVV